MDVFECSDRVPNVSHDDVLFQQRSAPGVSGAVSLF
jgi:hypothetical protein